MILIRILASLLLIFSVQKISAQKMIYITEPILNNNKTVDELRLEDHQIDEIRYEGQLIYTRLQFEQDTLDYFKVNDTIYYHRKFSNNITFSEGPYKVNGQPSYIDTVYTFHPETFESQIMIVSCNNIEKCGRWQEIDLNGIFWYGNYLGNERTGRWFKSNDKINFYKYGEYDNGKLSTIYEPDSSLLMQNVDWIINQQFYWCLLSYFENPQGREMESWWLNIDNSIECESYGKFTFFANGEFEYLHNDKYQLKIKELGGKGSWRINEEGNLEINFRNNEKKAFVVTLLSAEQMKIRVKK